ncbi:MAG: gamma-glutamyl-gamma-aminobutyrate hydrolase family protein [Chloroflexota bacterium]|nr:gamma-glutamyl-gamma-aminobutyrate hydrolase family protein [Chloroflexota bacterium]
MTKPRVALTLCGHDAAPCRRARDEYVSALERAGALVVACGPRDDPHADFDALCLSGGGDIDPLRYAAENAASRGIDLDRDAAEFALAQRALLDDIPILGICRGFQLLNVALGGTLIQHVEGHEQRLADAVLHIAVPEPGSRLADTCGAEPQRVNSSHHQAVTPATLAPGLRPTVLVDGSVEAFESHDHGFVVGVQWHPERTQEVDAAATRIFDGLVGAAAGRLAPATIKES